MSWGFSVTATAPDAVPEALAAARENALKTAQLDSYDDDVEKQIALAVDVAGALANAVGEQHVNVSVSGHARRGENDPNTISVGVYGATAPPNTA